MVCRVAVKQHKEGPHLDRRALLKTAGLALAGLGAGCAGKRVAADVPRRPPVKLAPVKCSWDRVIHTTVGLRPHRDAGFVVKPEKLDHKTVIHNYGHGGAGMSTSWGTAYLAAEMALAHTSRRAAVLGSGVTGLTSARQLQRRGFDVTLYAENVPPHTTSNMSLAGWTPTSGLVSVTGRTPQWDEQFRAAAEIAYRELQLLAGRPDYGVTWIDGYSTMDEYPPERGETRNPLLPEHLRTGREVLGPGEHPFPLKYATRQTSMRIEPAIYLDALVRDVRRNGARTEIRKFETLGDLMTLSEPLIINCTGLGSRDLFGDEELVPLKGQLTLLIPQPEVDYHTSGGLRSPDATPGIGIHMMPRNDGIALGGTSERGEWSLEPNEEAMKRVVEGHIELFSAMHW